jgi:3-methylcrotonyl-CoA carboxylase alpha subunit
MEIIHKNKRVEVVSNESAITIDDRKSDFAYEKFNDNIFKISINGITKLCYAAEDEQFIYVFVEGEQFIFEKYKEEASSVESLQSEFKDKEVIKPPMPGSIVKILVEPNQKVGEGEPIVIVEAMKMEITLYSSIEGIVSEINVQVGEQVDSDKVLVVINRNSG